MTQTLRCLSVLVLCAVFDACLSKPTEVLVNLEAVDPAQQQQRVTANTGVKRDQRSPQFGFQESFNPYPEYVEGHHHKHHHHHHHHHEEPEQFEYPQSSNGGGGSFANAQSGSFNFGGSGGYFPGSPSGEGSFASANAGSANSGSPFGGGSQANAESASFNFGPVSASFSLSQASSRSK